LINGGLAASEVQPIHMGVRSAAKALNARRQSFSDIRSLDRVATKQAREAMQNRSIEVLQRSRVRRCRKRTRLARLL
jgi:hypothetical protein